MMSAPSPPPSPIPRSNTYEKILEKLQSPARISVAPIASKPISPPRGATEAGTLKRKYAELHEVVEVAGTLKSLLNGHNSPRIRKWAKATHAMGEDMIRDALLEFLQELRCTTACHGIDLGSIALTCPVCHELFTQNRAMLKLSHCRHTLCLECHGKHTENKLGRGQTKCPVCNTAFTSVERVAL